MDRTYYTVEVKQQHGLWAVVHEYDDIADAEQHAERTTHLYPQPKYHVRIIRKQIVWRNGRFKL